MEVSLNDVQRAAVEHAGSPSLVLAGAGSGKTRVLTARLAHLVQHHDVHPGRIIAVTFTNRAAKEMRDRVARLLGRDPAGLWIGTFHSLSARLLRREAHLLEFTNRFTIYDEVDSTGVIKKLLEEGGYSHKTYPPKLIRSMVSAAKNRMVTPDETEAAAMDKIERAAAVIHRQLGPRLHQQNAMDFDDLLLHPLTLFRDHPDRLAHYQEKFRCVLVDEFQDTNLAQYLFVKALSAQHRDLCVVGDDDQSIYAWRGANVRNMLDFDKDFPDAVTFRLEENYRSTQMILDAANGVISANSERLGKTLFTARRGGEPVTIVTTADERDEAEWVAREIRQRVASDLYGHQDIGVLYRTNSQSRAIEDAFRRVSIPYRVIGSVSFYARREVRDLVAYLRLIANPADDEAFLRAIQVPKRGLGPATISILRATAATWGRTLLDTATIADRINEIRPRARTALHEFANMIMRLGVDSETLDPAQLLERVVEGIDYEAHLAKEGVEGMERIEHVKELMSSAAEWSEEVHPDDPSTPLERFLSSAALTSSAEVDAGDPEGVTLMTVHTAKGLEWPIVIGAGFEDGLFPLSRTMESLEGEEEERRLAYVAITRAQDRLYLTWAKARRRNGQLMPGLPSRFLESIPPDVSIEHRTSGVFGGDMFRKPAVKRKPAFDVEDFGFSDATPEEDSQDAPRYIKGERVMHRTFGSGTILGLMGSGRDLKVTVDFDDEESGVKQLLVAYAGLEREFDPA